MITMIAYVTLGSNNFENAELFYSASFSAWVPLFKEGKRLEHTTKPGEMTPPPPDVYIKTPSMESRPCR